MSEKVVNMFTKKSVEVDNESTVPEVSEWNLGCSNCGNRTWMLDASDKTVFGYVLLCACCKQSPGRVATV